jgi:hypothetical protein
MARLLQLLLVSAWLGLGFGATELAAQTEYAVMVREAGTRKTFYGGGTTSRGSHNSRMFIVCRIDFSNPFARTITLRGICHVKKSGRTTIFSPFSNTDPEYTGTSYLVDAGKSGLMDMMVVTANDSDEKAWYFPQGKASVTTLSTGGANRLMALRATLPPAFSVDTNEQIVEIATGMVITLDPSLSRELNALSPSDLIDAGSDLISLLTGKGWINQGFDAF